MYVEGLLSIQSKESNNVLGRDYRANCKVQAT